MTVLQSDASITVVGDLTNLTNKMNFRIHDFKEIMNSLTLVVLDFLIITVIILNILPAKTEEKKKRRKIS